MIQINFTRVDYMGVRVMMFDSTEKMSFAITRLILTFLEPWMRELNRMITCHQTVFDMWMIRLKCESFLQTGQDELNRDEKPKHEKVYKKKTSNKP